MNELSQLLLEQKNVFVIDEKYRKNDFVSIDLSQDNGDLDSLVLNSASDFENYITNYVKLKGKKVAFGGYNEVRNLYKRSLIFNKNDETERNIHIGLDLWIDAYTPILAALDGKVHSLQNNEGLGNYGPTIIMQHFVKNYKFYTLYGHLSLDSLTKVKVGQKVSKGQVIGALGNNDVNGDYAPHLHFQIINDLKDFSGDYPGVCSSLDADYYLNNCPDPNLLLKL